MGLIPKEFNFEFKIKTLHDEANALHSEIEKIKNSKDALIAEVTLQKLSSIDVDFKENIEKLTDKIFNNKNKQIN